MIGSDNRKIVLARRPNRRKVVFRIDQVANRAVVNIARPEGRDDELGCSEQQAAALIRRGLPRMSQHFIESSLTDSHTVRTAASRPP